ncbi:MAG: YceI family protein [Verrucomicrobia bacterium]|nr:YceI family protein [Verrucomicrobiota bacterium]
MNLKRNFLLGLAVVATLPLFCCVASAGDKYVGYCDVVFEGDSTLHGFTGNISNVPLTVICETNSAGEAWLNTRIEIGPRQLTTHHAKRDANMHKMFQADLFPRLIAVVTNAPLAAANLSPSSNYTSPGTLPVQLTFCGITKDVQARTVNPLRLVEGWEFQLETDISLKDFKLKPRSALLGAISVRDLVRVKAHVKLQREPP